MASLCHKKYTSGNHNFVIYKKSSLVSEIGDSSYVSCYQEVDPRSIPHKQNSYIQNGVTAAKCIVRCIEVNYPIAATHNGGECYCGEQVGQAVKKRRTNEVSKV